ncbi:MAG: CAAX prenyl protease-related protein [Bryobacteraceae bacterium]|jgi:CAAX prenyl protease-like protein
MTLRHPALAYTAPFVYFLICLAVLPKLGMPPRAELGFWLASGLAVTWLFSRRLFRFRITAPVSSAAVGAAVFLLWVAPDTLWPGWRSHWLFSNPLFGQAGTTLPDAALQDSIALWLRTARAVVLVPVVEELFWRGWLMRWIENPDFERVPSGSWHPRAFWITAILFALEHGVYWEVGLVAGAVYNAWMIRTKCLGDLILAHAATNGMLCAWILATGRYEFWQ